MIADAKGVAGVPRRIHGSTTYLDRLLPTRDSDSM
jgi:hypothetical protein